MLTLEDMAFAFEASQVLRFFLPSPWEPKASFRKFLSDDAVVQLWRLYAWEPKAKDGRGAEGKVLKEGTLIEVLTFAKENGLLR